MPLYINPLTGNLLTSNAGLLLAGDGSMTPVGQAFADGTFWSDDTGWTE